MKKDKQRVEQAAWSDDHLRSFLQVTDYDGEDSDYICLLRAYQHMTLPMFERFLQLFTQAGRRLDAHNKQGECLLDLVRTHRSSSAYAQALEHYAAAQPR